MEETSSWLDSDPYVAPPLGVAEVATDVSASPWQPNVDPATGATYYYNTLTQETSWTNPTKISLPAGGGGHESGNDDDEELGSPQHGVSPQSPASFNYGEVSWGSGGAASAAAQSTDEYTAMTAAEEALLVPRGPRAPTLDTAALHEPGAAGLGHSNPVVRSSHAQSHAATAATSPEPALPEPPAAAAAPVVLPPPVPPAAEQEASAAAASAAATGRASSLVSAVDPITGRTYYYNESTGETTWAPYEDDAAAGAAAAVQSADEYTAMTAAEEALLVPRGPRAPTLDAAAVSAVSADSELAELPGLASKARRRSSAGFGALAAGFAAATRALGAGGQGQPPQQPSGPLPPPAPSVPVDALARAGARSNKWLEYVKKHLLATDHVQDAGIFDLRNCARWAATTDFLPRHYHVLDDGGGQHGVNEAASTVFLMKSGQVPRLGLRFNGVRYELESITLVPPSRPHGLARWAVGGTKAAPERTPSNSSADPHWQWSGGICLVRTARAVVVATWCTQRGHSAEVCQAAVDGLARFMADYAC